MIHCATCGKAIPKDSRFCTFCGATVPVIDPDKPNVATPSTITPPNLESSKPAPSYASTSYQHTTAATTTTVIARNLPFYMNPGFYGALLIIAGFFLPWLGSASGFQLAQEYLNRLNDSVYIFLIVVTVLPVLGAIVVLLNSFTGSFTGVTGLFKWLAFLSVATFVGLMLLGTSVSNENSGGNDQAAANLVGTFGIGLWLTILGAVVILFNKRVRSRVV